MAVITQVDVKGYRQAGTATADITLRFFAADGGGFPTGAELGNETVSSASFAVGTPTVVNVAVSPNISITPNVKYIVTLEFPTGTFLFDGMIFSQLSSYDDTLREDVASFDGGSNWSAGSACAALGIQTDEGELYSGAGAVGAGWNNIYAPFQFGMWFINAAVPEKAVTPSPANAATGVDIPPSQLTWVDGGSAETYNVYFGPSGNMSLVSEGQAGLTFDLSGQSFDYGTTYQWRIDSINDYGTTTGDTWSFTTASFDPPAVGGGGDGTGENTMQTLKRLVVASNNKIWYES